MNATQQPLLDDAEIATLISQASGWQGLQLPWTERVRQQGRMGGQASQQRGNGLDFVESRPYQPGDEPRHIDWRASARTGQPYVRIFHEERSPAACFLIDRRASMRFGTRHRLKVAQAARLAIFLATFEARQGSEVGAVILNETLQWLPPTSGLNGIQKISRLCNTPCPPLPTPSGNALEKVLVELTERLSDGTNIYLFSDFMDLSNSALPALSHLGQRHYVHAINIQDRAEYQLPSAGMLQLSWSGLEQTVDSDHPGLQADFTQHMVDRLADLQALFSKCGIRIDALPSDIDDIVAWLQELTA